LATMDICSTPNSRLYSWVEQLKRIASPALAEKLTKK
jgi:hypothetical protein